MFTNKYIFCRVIIIFFKILGISILERYYDDTFKDAYSIPSILKRFNVCLWLVELYGFLNNSVYKNNSEYQQNLHKYLNEAMELNENNELDYDEQLMYLIYKRSCTVIRRITKTLYSIQKALINFRHIYM